MFVKISKFFVIVSIFSLLVFSPDLFFPFTSGKIIFFKVAIELAALSFIFHFVFSKNFWEEIDKLRSRFKNPIFIGVGAFTAIFLLAALFGVNPQFSFWSNFERGEGAFQIIHYFLFFALLLFLFSEKKSILNLIKINFAISLAISLYALGQFLTNSGILPDQIFGFFTIYGAVPQVPGTLGNPSYLSAYLLINFALGILLFLNTKKSSWKIFLIAVLIFEGIIFWLTQTRGAFLGLLAGVISFLIISVFVLKKPVLPKPYLAVCLFLLIFLPMLLLLTRDASLWKASPQIKRLTNPSSVIERSWTWGSALCGFIERPILGWGAENFPFVFDKYYNPKHYGASPFFDRAHNIFLDHLINGGILLLIAYLSIFYFYYRSLLKLERNLPWAILFVLPIAYFVQGFFLFEVLSIYIILFLFLAFFINFYIYKEPIIYSSESSLDLKKFPIAIVTLAITAFLIYLGSYLPLRKNLLIKNGFYNLADEKKLDVRFESFYNALIFFSPVGRDEVSYHLFRSTYDYLKMREKSGNPLKKEEVNVLMKVSNDQFDRYENEFIGIKNIYAVGFLNLEAARYDRQYLKRGKALLEKALKSAPTRLELIMPLIDVAKFENDKETLLMLRERVKMLRPDVLKD